MRKYLFFIILFPFSIPLFSQQDDQQDEAKVAFVSYWDVGDSYDFKVSKIKQRWDEGEMTKDEVQEYIATFSVIDETESSYTINWSYKNDLNNLFDIPEEILDEFSDLEEVEIIYKTTEVGDFLEILNWKEIGEDMVTLFDKIIELAGKEDEALKSELNQMMGPFKQIYSSQQGIEMLVMKELQYFHFLMGVEFEIAEPIYYEDELPNMFGGKPIKANAKLTFEEVDFENSFCVVKQEMDLDPKDTKGILLDVFKKMKLNNRQMKKAFKTAVFEIKDRNTFEYFFYPGIPYRIETIRESNFNLNNVSGKRIDKVIIELLYED